MEHRARKRFGQNFLADPLVVRRIVDAIAPRPGEVIVEIGPGKAALTEPLAESGAELHLLEIDRDLAALLQRQFDGHPGVRLHLGDALRTDFAEISGGRPFRLVGNLPYNISTPLLFHVLRWSALVTDMHFMLQQEVVERMAAGRGGKARGRLSVMCQYHCTVTPLFTVPPVEVGDFARFERLVAQAFSMRRKTLRNSLRGLLDAERIAAAGVDPGLRPEALTLEQFAALCDQLD
jgi:16S rRNA (adenine1518-N6/adenine1519-N6)-dimethyltransferase